MFSQTGLEVSLLPLLSSVSNSIKVIIVTCVKFPFYLSFFKLHGWRGLSVK